MDKVLNELDHAAINIESISIDAGKCGRVDIVDAMIERGAKSFDMIEAAAQEGRKRILDAHDRRYDWE